MITVPDSYIWCAWLPAEYSCPRNAGHDCDREPSWNHCNNEGRGSRSLQGFRSTPRRRNIHLSGTHCKTRRMVYHFSFCSRGSSPPKNPEFHCRPVQEIKEGRIIHSFMASFLFHEFHELINVHVVVTIFIHHIKELVCQVLGSFRSSVVMKPWLSSGFYPSSNLELGLFEAQYYYQLLNICLGV